MKSLPTQEQLSHLAALVSTSFADPMKCVSFALDLWDEAGDCIETIKGHEAAAQRGPNEHPADTFPCPDCRRPMLKTALDSWCCYGCGVVWSFAKSTAVKQTPPPQP